MTRRSSLRPGEQPPQAVLDRIGSYTPRWSKPDKKTWNDSLSTPVRDWVTFVCPRTEEVARTLLTYASGYCLWHLDKYRNLEPTKVWKRRTIEHWVHVEMAHKSEEWRGAADDRLKSMGRLINPSTSWPPAPQEQARRPRLTGYTVAEELAYVDAALAYRRGPRPRLLFFFAATFGAGISGTEVLSITASDVLVSGDDISLRVTDTEGVVREVPVRRMYHDMLLEAVATATTTLLIGEPKRNTVTELCHRIEVEGLERIRSIRMRATWLERHIENGTEIPLLLELAGTSSGESVLQAAQRVGISDRQAALAHSRLA